MSRAEKGKIVGCYVRVSTTDRQDKGLASQMRAVKQYCDNHSLKPLRFYKDTITGASTSRPQFDKLQADIFNGRVHTVVFWKLDRVTRRGIKDGLNILTDWLKKGVRIISTTERIDLDGAMGELQVAIFLAIARMQREALIKNTKRGMAAAKARGVKLGKRSKLFSKDVLPLLKSGKSVSEVAEHFGVHRQTVYALLWREGIDLEELTGTK